VAPIKKIKKSKAAQYLKKDFNIISTR